MSTVDTIARLLVEHANSGARLIMFLPEEKQPRGEWRDGIEEFSYRAIDLSSRRVHEVNALVRERFSRDHPDYRTAVRQRAQLDLALAVMREVYPRKSTALVVLGGPGDVVWRAPERLLPYGSAIPYWAYTGNQGR